MQLHSESSGGDGNNFAPPLTTFDGPPELPKRRNGSVVGRYDIGDGSRADFAEYHPFSAYELSDLYKQQTLGYLAIGSPPALDTYPEQN